MHSCSPNKLIQPKKSIVSRFERPSVRRTVRKPRVSKSLNFIPALQKCANIVDDAHSSFCRHLHYRV